MNKLERISAFITIVEQRSLVNAAKTLHLTPAAISKQLASLETELGVSLLHRNTRHASLTEIGEQYYLQAKKIVEQVIEADTLVSETRAVPMGSLRITCSRYFAEHVIMPHIIEFTQRFPKINLHLEVAERLPDFLREDIDILLGVSTVSPQADLVSRQMLSTRYIFCASPNYLKDHGTPKTPEAIRHHRYITHAMRLKPSFVSFGRHPDIHVEPFMWCNDSKTMCDAAIQGIGIIKVHDYFVEQALADGRLLALFPEQPEPVLPIYLCYRKDRYTQPKIKAFVEFYLKKLEG